MAVVVPSNSAKASHIAWQDVTTTNQVAGTTIVVNNGSTIRKRAIRFFIRLGRRSGNAFTTGWPNVRIDASPTDSGDADWTSIYSYQMALGASIANTTLNGGVSAGATSIVVNAATNIASGDILFIAGNTAAENEIVRVRTVSGTTVNLDAGTPLNSAKASGNAVTDQAEIPMPLAFGCETIRRIRVIVDNAGGGQTVAAEVSYVMFDAEDVV